MQLAIVIPVSELGGLPGLGIGNQLPTPPVYPGHGLPGGPARPGHDLPGGPVEVPQPPIHLPPQVGTLPIYPADPTHPIALPPGSVWPPLGPSVPQGKALALIYISGIGARWTVIDTTLQPGQPLPGGPPPMAGQLPGQTPQPKY